jgi:hypothetical protein
MDKISVWSAMISLNNALELTTFSNRQESNSMQGATNENLDLGGKKAKGQHTNQSAQPPTPDQHAKSKCIQNDGATYVQPQ